MKRSSSEQDPLRFGQPAAHIDSTAERGGTGRAASLGNFIDGSPRMSAQRRQLRAMTDAPIQRVQNYAKSVLTSVPVAPSFTSAKVGAFTVPKRMLARPLALPNGIHTGKRETVNTPLWQKLKAEQEAIAFKDGHLLNHKFGGPADARNMVPISTDANAQMIPFDAHVEALLTRGVVVDLEVSANYGRNDGLTSAQNAIPTSLDMRMIPQRLDGQAWVDDREEPVVVQNVKINLESDSNQSKKAKRKSTEYVKRDQVWANFGVLANAAPQATEEGPEQPDDQLARKNEKERQANYRSFTTLPQWTRWKQDQREKGRDKGAQDIVSGNLVDAAWIGAHDSEEFEMDESQIEKDEFDEFDLESYLIDTLVSQSTDWMEKAGIVQNNPSLIGKVRALGWTDVANLLTDYLALDLSKYRVTTV
ncbi:hypothetical protein [Luteibacter yeojuensis]|uniref:Uncharacterized protein n=1 Tax=Luteibacter yeojuensis TaxID=345309 RepID=A0A7X5TNJ5_9GAMM|nr:hypothetical protein [Luteibacter yeojuensis]NID14596.1 hypothetical protein [Luteibacter yeojuensis]